MSIPSRIVNLTIVAITLATAQAGFSRILILTEDTLKVGNTFTNPKLYQTSESGLSELAKDFETTSEAYKAAQAIASQSPKVDDFLVGLRQTAEASVADINFGGDDPDFVTGNLFRVTVNRVDLEIPFTVDNPGTLSAIATAIGNVDGVDSAVAGTNKVTVTAVVDFSLVIENMSVTGGATKPDPSVDYTTPGRSIADDIQDMINTNNSWYPLIINSTAEGPILSAAKKIQTLDKVFGYAQADATILTTATTDTPSKIKSQVLSRAFGCYAASPSEYVHAAAFSRFFAVNIGSSVINGKTLVGITPDSLTETQIENAIGKNVNTYTTVNAKNMIETGKMGNGDYLDTIVNIDFVKARLSEALFGFITNSEKIPYTNAGLGAQEGVMKSALVRMSSDPNPILIKESIQVNVTSRENSTLNDRANRLSNATFSAELQGAVQSTKIDGTLSV